MYSPYNTQPPSPSIHKYACKLNFSMPSPSPLAEPPVASPSSTPCCSTKSRVLSLHLTLRLNPALLLQSTTTEPFCDPSDGNILSGLGPILAKRSVQNSMIIKIDHASLHSLNSCVDPTVGTSTFFLLKACRSKAACRVRLTIYIHICF